MESQRRLLQELLGTSSTTIKDFRDDKVCRYYLAGLCPHELFANTKHFLGTCNKVHDDGLRQAYQDARSKKDYGYERELENYLDQIIHKLDRDIQRALQKVDEEIRISAGNTVTKLSSSSSSSHPKTDPLQAEIAVLSKQIADILDESEQKGHQGEIIQSYKLLEEAENLQRKKKEKQQQQQQNLQNSMEDKDATSTKANHLKNFQKLRPCDICGLSLSLLDSDERLADHFAGKLHIGWAQIRKKYKELQENRTQHASSGRYSSSSNKRDRSYSPDRHRRSRSPDRKYGSHYTGSGNNNDRSRGNYRDRDYYRDNDRNYRGRY